jgi:hypothetical protein
VVGRPLPRASGVAAFGCRAARLKRAQAPILVGLEAREIGLDHRQPIAILFGRADQAGHLLLDRIEARIERADAGLGRRRLV